MGAKIFKFHPAINLGCCAGGRTTTAALGAIPKVGDRGQIVIPKEARELFGIRPGDTLLILGESDTGLIVSRPEVLNDLANEILNNVKKED